MTGCAGRVERPLNYTVAVSPSFSPSAQEAIVVAWDSWRAAVPELSGKVYVGDCSGADICVQEDLSLQRQPSGVEEGWAASGGSLTLFTNSVFAYADDAGLDPHVEMQRIATHELGHALGLGHSADGNVMAPTIMKMALSPTPADVQAFWK